MVQRTRTLKLTHYPLVRAGAFRTLAQWGKKIALEPTADRVRQYVTAVTSMFPSIRIGLIEAYPFSS